MNKRILVTGGSRGLGLCFIKKYLLDGDTVFAGARNISNPDFQELVEQYPKTMIPVVLDVSDTPSVNTAYEKVKKETDQLDIIINNAAIHGDSSFETLEDTNLDECLPVYNINSVGPLRVIKAFLPLLKVSSLGKVINISSESGSLTTCQRDKEFDYCMSKAALNMGTTLLSNYLKKENIIVLAAHPGWMRTDMGGSHAHLDPYETACDLVELFNNINNIDHPIFIDNTGNSLEW